MSSERENELRREHRRGGYEALMGAAAGFAEDPARVWTSEEVAALLHRAAQTYNARAGEHDA